MAMTKAEFDKWYETLSEVEKQELLTWAANRVTAKLDEAMDLLILGQREEAAAILETLEVH